MWERESKVKHTQTSSKDSPNIADLSCCAVPLSYYLHIKNQTTCLAADLVTNLKKKTRNPISIPISITASIVSPTVRMKEDVALTDASVQC